MYYGAELVKSGCQLVGAQDGENIIYLTAPFVEIFLRHNVTPVEAWSCL